LEVKMELTVDKEIFKRAPELNIGVLVIAGMDNSADIGGFVKKEYSIIEEKVRSKFDGIELSEYPVVKIWREIYKGFGEKKARSSLESLIRRVAGGKGIYSINPLVDIYNLASLKFELPCGGEDTDAMTSDLTLTFADGSESFTPLGEAVIERPNEGEIVYKFGDTVVCRNFNYRESDITKLTDKTKNAIIIFEDAVGDIENLQEALNWVGDKAVSLLGAESVSSSIISNTA